MRGNIEISGSGVGIEIANKARMMLVDEEIDYGGVKQRLTVHSPFLDGRSFQILIDNYLEGHLHRVGDEWRYYASPRRTLTMDDVDAIRELIQQALQAGRSAGAL